MQRIRIFIASSSEMRKERLELGDLLADMSEADVDYIPVKWEYMDSSLHEERKEDEYLRQLRKSEVCIVMLWRTLGQYTKEELEVALAEQEAGNKPRVIRILFKEGDGEATPELVAYRTELEQKHGSLIHTFNQTDELRDLVRTIIQENEKELAKDNEQDKRPLQEVKVMVAADEELHDAKLEFTELINTLYDALAVRGIRLRRIKWLPGESEAFKERLGECDMCLNLYWRQLPDSSQDEVDVAYGSHKAGSNPRRLYIFFKEPCEGISEALSDFKASFENQYGHFFCRFENVDTMKLQFTLQFESMQNQLSHDLVKVENGTVVLGGVAVASMDNLKFAAGNDGYQKMKEELDELPDEIEMFRMMADKHPDQQKYSDQLQKKLNRYNALKEEYAKLQDNLLATAKRISEMQLEKLSSELQRAIDEFENGHIEASNAILDSIEREAERHIEQLDYDRKLVHQDIEALMLKTKTLMADSSIPVEDRIQQTWDTYKKADAWAEKSALGKDKYAQLLFDYADFLYGYGHYKESEEIWLRQIAMAEEVYGKEHTDTAASYINIGIVYNDQEDYSKALEYYTKSLEICEKMLGKEPQLTACSYNNIGTVYYEQNDYTKSLEYYTKSLKIDEEILGKEHPSTARSYGNIALVYKSQSDYAKALEYLVKALKIFQKALGNEHPDIASTYHNIGRVYYAQENYNKALKYYFKSLKIREFVLGNDHPDTASSYDNIGCVYARQKNYSSALEYFEKAYQTFMIKLGENHPITIQCNNYIATVKAKMAEEND